MQEKYYEGTPKIINLSTEIGRLLGLIDATYLDKPKTALRKENKIKTIRASLAIEGNTLSEAQITAILEHKGVLGSVKEIREVRNAIKVYDDLSQFDPFAESSYLKAHGLLMLGLADRVGEYRRGNVGIVQGNQVTHLVPPAWNVSFLMNNLFSYLKDGADNLIIKSCVFHYEMEFIHPFEDGNGRMGRLWQTIILMQVHPVFEYLLIEHEIKKSQEEYYNVLSASDREGLSTIFIEYMLEKIKVSLEQLTETPSDRLTDQERLDHFIVQAKTKSLTRKTYMQFHNNISSATATRDLKQGVQEGKLRQIGQGRVTRYEII
ncbi:MAG: Fic family protein [Bacteroidota bacterium]